MNAGKEPAVGAGEGLADGKLQDLFIGPPQGTDNCDVSNAHHRSPCLQASTEQPQNSPHFSLSMLCGPFAVAREAQGVEHPGPGSGHYIAVSKARPLYRLGRCLWTPSPQLLTAHVVGDGIAPEDTESLFTFKCWKLAIRKYVEKFRGVIGFGKAGGEDSRST